MLKAEEILMNVLQDDEQLLNSDRNSAQVGLSHLAVTKKHGLSSWTKIRGRLCLRSENVNNSSELVVVQSSFREIEWHEVSTTRR